MFSAILHMSAYASLLVLLLFPIVANANNRHLCSPSSCGTLRNISSPFRLKGHPKKCGKLELVCENNRTVFYLSGGKYYVRDINYVDYTIRVVDVNVQKNNCSSLPASSLHEPYYLGLQPASDLSLLLFVECEKAVSSCVYIDTSPCIISSTKRHSYVFILNSTLVSELADTCYVDRTAMAYLQGMKSSFSDIHNDMANGFILKFSEYRTSPIQYIVTVLEVAVMTLAWYLTLQTGSLRTGSFVVAVCIGFRIICGITCTLPFIIYKFRRRHLSMYDNIEDFLQSQNNFMPIRYSYWEIKTMTKGFKDKLGQGGFGSVYKGKLRSGCLVAIKILDNSKANGQDFINEVATIGRIHHFNVVRLIGFCAARSKRALVYDFMPNGSLDKYIFSKEGKSMAISCEKMFEIALGVARGIEYLHRGCNMQILHFDIKPHNILLDENFNPKVSDFGLAKLYSTNDNTVSLTTARGTMGYIAPEFFYKNIGGISYKADVYSFGMLLMEMVGRRKNLNAFASHPSQIYFPSWVYEQLSEGKDVENEITSDEEREMVKKMIVVALWCIQMNPKDRPSMKKVIGMLEGNANLLETPPDPFVPQEIPTEDHESSANHTETSTL